MHYARYGAAHVSLHFLAQKMLFSCTPSSRGIGGWNDLATLQQMLAVGILKARADMEANIWLHYVSGMPDKSSVKLLTSTCNARQRAALLLWSQNVLTTFGQNCHAELNHVTYGHSWIIPLMCLNKWQKLITHLATDSTTSARCPCQKPRIDYVLKKGASSAARMLKSCLWHPANIAEDCGMCSATLCPTLHRC